MAEFRTLVLWWLLIILVVAGGSAGANHVGSDADMALAAVLALMASLAVPLARYAPRSAVLLNAVVVGAYFAAGLANGPVFLTVPLVALVASQRARPRALLPWLAAALGLVVAGLVRRVIVHDASVFVSFWQAVGISALSLAACAVGWWLVGRREVRAERAQRAVSDERLRMAQDLHDGVGHGLAVIAMQAGVALHVFDKEPEQVRANLEAIRETSRESLDALRAELARISGMSAAPRRPAPGSAELDALIARVRAGGLAVTLNRSPPELGEVSDETGRAVYAVVQESLTNVLRHAQASAAAVTLRRTSEATGDRISVTIEDDGHGALGHDARVDAEPPSNAEGMGIASMRARVERVGGTLEVGRTEHGFRVVAELPVWP